MNMELKFEIHEFINREAALLDDRKFNDWLNLLSEDIVYRMPIRVTREAKEGPNIVDDMTFFEETKKSLTTRVKRLGTTSAWAEDPAPRTRHFISNILIEETTDNQEIHVRSWFLCMRSRAGNSSVEQIFGERKDVLRKVNDDWLISARTIYPDQAVLSVMNLSMFL